METVIGDKPIPPGITRQARRVCPECDAQDIIKYGTRKGIQIYLCKPCGVCFTDNGVCPIEDSRQTV